MNIYYIAEIHKTDLLICGNFDRVNASIITN